MKLSKLLIIAIGALFFSACTTEEDDSLTRHELAFQVSMGYQETRAIPDNSWSEDDYIFVKVGEDVKQYKVTFDGDGSPKAVGIDVNNTFYWEDFGGSSITVTAWSFAKKEINSLDGTITVELDQSDEQNYYNSDFLYAPSTTIRKTATPELKFYHQMARVNINIKCDEDAEISSVVLGDMVNQTPIFYQATFTEPFVEEDDEDADPYHGYFDVDYDEATTITPCKVSTVTGYDASYSAILIPSPVESFAITITLSDNDNTQFFYMGGIYEYDPDGPLPFDPGTVNTFNITIKNKELTVDGSVNEMGEPIDPVSVNDWRIHQ